ncbi:DUF4184 family protein [Kitasatospora sp. HPMI-4]|uniref:DUF4184 family protein n=1 Tax=Kitasatospora sp. HPMI-4 TaxID=3448443 RepID=UPI003F1D1E5C
MPFTLSHPAAVLPLLSGGRARGPLVAVGLVTGALAPDVPFYAESVLRGTYGIGAHTHRWWAVPTLDVAIAGALAAGWQWLLREPVPALLPVSWAAAAAVTADGGRPAAGWFAVSAAIGAATHVGWDEFTHRGRAGVRAFPVLSRRLAGVPLYRLLQYGGSVVGLAEVIRYAAALPPTGQGPLPVLPTAVRRAGVAVLCLSAAAGAAHRLLRRHGDSRLDECCFGAGAGLALGAVGYALAVRLLTARREDGAG